MQSQLIKEALKILDEGLLPGDLDNVYIFVKIVSLFALVTVLSGGVGFYLGLCASKLG